MRDKTFIKSLFSGLIYALGFILLFFLIRIFMGRNGFWDYGAAIITIIAFVVVYAFSRSYKEKVEAKRNPMYKFFFYGIRAIIFITLMIGIWGIYTLMSSSDCPSCAVYQAVGLGLIIVWACIFLSYFIWAIYFYNINLGLTEEDWDRIKQAKESKRSGDYYSEEDIAEEPAYNPYKDETFGLPPGTVRVMIAFTLLFGALAMLIVSIGMNNEINRDSIFFDQYEFFKTAFLMMIAFYFGTRSLQYLKSSKGSDATAPPSKASENTTPSIFPPSAPAVEPMPNPGDLPVDPMQEADDEKGSKDENPGASEDVEKTPTDKTFIPKQIDPMNPKT